MKTIKTIVNESFSIYRKFPVTIVPFLFSALCNALALYVLYLAPQRPVSALLAPPIRAFLGEKFLHYPYNLLKLASLFNIASLCIAGTVGLLLTGAALIMIRDASHGTRPVMSKSIFASLRRYGSLFSVWLVMFLVTYFRSVIETFLLKVFTMVPILAEMIFYFVFIFIQIIFLYVMAALLFEKVALVKAFKRGFSVLQSSLLTTAMIAASALVIYFPLMVAQKKLYRLIQFFSPDVIVWVLSFGIIVTLVIDCLVTFSAVWVFRQHSR